MHYSDAYWTRLRQLLHNFVLAALHGIGMDEVSDDVYAPWPLPDESVRVEPLVLPGPEPHTFLGPNGGVPLSWAFLLGDDDALSLSKEEA